MYLRSKLVKFLQTKNAVFLIMGVLLVASSAYVLISLFSTYKDIEIVKEARATPESILHIKIGVILLIISGISKRLIGNASFYCSYFEGDLDGYIKYEELADVSGKSKYSIIIQLYIFRFIYMKGYTLDRNSKQIVLKSKTSLCECRNCGAEIEKKIYFTGICSYCGSSDLFAKVITNNKFYSVENNITSGINKPDFYTGVNIIFRKILFSIFLILLLCIVSILIMMSLDYIFKYNDKEYLTEVLLSGESYSSFELIKREIFDTILFNAVFITAFIPVIYIILKKIIYITRADMCSKYFAACNTPFVNISKIPVNKNKLSGKIRAVNRTLRHRYLVNCNFEKHDGKLKLALAKKIVKDKCPFCGAPIVGAVDEKYKCSYCNAIIMDTISKK